jgi:hypothetical protein
MEEALHLPLAPTGEPARRQHPGEQAADPIQQQQALDDAPSLLRPGEAGIEVMVRVEEMAGYYAFGLDEVEVLPRRAGTSLGTDDG